MLPQSFTTDRFTMAERNQIGVITVLLGSWHVCRIFNPCGSFTYCSGVKEVT